MTEVFDLHEQRARPGARVLAAVIDCDYPVVSGMHEQGGLARPSQP